MVTELREGSGTAGQVEIAVDRLRIAGNGRVDTSTRGVGNAGDILVDEAESISISDAISDEEFSGISSLSQPEAAGDAGSIRVSAPEIDVLDGARISTRAFGGGDAGEIDVRFSDRMAIIGGAIEASAEQALGGNIQLDSGRVTALADGTLAMEPYSGPVGESLVLQDASITTSVGSGTGLGGNVGIQADEVLLVRSAITADADESNAGNIRIAADRFIRDDTSIVRASSNKAADGIVEIIAPESVLIPPLVELPSRFLDVSSLLRDICARGDAGGGSLVVLGADGVPTGPETLLQAPIRLAEGVTPSGDGQPALAQVWPVYGADPFGGFEWCRSGAR